ncbi:hypothetical protein [Bacillus sp. V2I10]|uniref:hypothetical protein n=1 Tax=Bacillus sp. V2I10 TaxID=3042276 RepID=UPI002787F21E|nr:hypothetical protein [Bacillus sp. V2I10]MDQ0857340.1 hypothetical protein [Bacillus sp. V2I10]
MKKKLIIRIPFNNIGANEESFTKEWIERRISIFMNYTLKSLKGQSSQDYLALVLYNPKTEDKIKTALNNHRPLPNNVRFIPSQLFEAVVKNTIKGSDLLYEVHLESDDMYHQSFIEVLLKHTHKKNTAALIPQYGYVYDSIQNRLGRFFFWKPSFGAFIYNVNDYLKGKRYELGWRGALKLPYEFICVKEPIWINHIHSKNTGISFNKILSWQVKAYIGDCNLDPWTDSEKPRAHFGPEITDKKEIKRILEKFI